MKPINGNGFLYAKGNIPVLVVAHMDTVFDEPPKRLCYKKNEDKIYNPDGGLGGDDRCGIYAILKLLENYKPYVLFTEDEEIGCVGASKSVKAISKPNVKYIIEFDCRGKDDCVFYDCGNDDFMDYVESFGLITDYGTCSDISVLGSAWDIASVNLSSGYYNEHTNKEYIIFNELQKTIKRASMMLKCLDKAPYFDYQEIIYEPQYQSHNNFPFNYLSVMSDEDFQSFIEQFCKPKNKEEDVKQYTLKRKKNNKSGDEK